MKFIYIALIVLVSAAVLVFTFQNMTSVSVRFLTAGVTLPMSALIILMYLVGMLTGGFMVSLVRSWLRGASQKKAKAR